MFISPNSILADVSKCLNRNRSALNDLRIDVEFSEIISRSELVRGNCIVTDYGSYSEVLTFKKPFKYTKGSDLVSLPDGSVHYCRFYDSNEYKCQCAYIRPKKANNRRFKKVADGCYVAVKANSDAMNIDALLAKSRKRAKDKFLRYARSNHWDYFMTFTIDQEKYGTDDQDIRGYFRKFMRDFKHYYPDFKYLFCVERQDNGCLHFHGLCADCPKDLFSVALFPDNYDVIELRGKPILHHGRQCYNFDSWSYGFSNCYILGQDHEDQQRIINYMIKYMSSDFAYEYNQRIFYRSDNLDYPKKTVLMLDDPMMLVDAHKYTWVKAHDKFNVYHLYENVQVRDCFNRITYLCPNMPLFDVRSVKSFDFERLTT